MEKTLYDGPIPDGFIRIVPIDEMGTITIRAKCVHMVFQAAQTGGLINLDGSVEVEYRTLVAGVAGGKKFSFAVQNPIREVMEQLQAAQINIVLNNDEDILTALPDSGESIH